MDMLAVTGQCHLPDALGWVEDHMCEDAGIFVCQEEDAYFPGHVDFGWRATPGNWRARE